MIPLLLYNDLGHLQHRVLDELRDHYYYPVTVPYALLYASEVPFGQRVYDQFPSARSDIVEAGKCLSLGQGTATVFHLMRAMEVMLRVLSRELGIGWAPSWESHIKQISTKMTEHYKKKSVTWKRKEPLFREICGDLNAVKMTWRNPTMHIVREYNLAEANSVYSAVRAFIQRMADANFKEKGKPVAIAIALASSA